MAGAARRLAEEEVQPQRTQVASLDGGGARAIERLRGAGWQRSGSGSATGLRWRVE